MSDEELQQYLGLLVEARLTSGETLLGRLLRDGAGSAYAIEQSSSNPDQGPTLIAVDSAAAIQTLRTVSAPPEMLD
ncbi:MAG TPA: hypothetical protein VGI19_14435 [Candidatus Cybelea sp.]